MKRKPLTIKQRLATLGAVLVSAAALTAFASAEPVSSPLNAPVQVAQASPSPSPTPSPKPFQVSAYADAGYQTASFASAPNAPCNAAFFGGPTCGNIITGRVFDTVSKTPQFHNFNIQASYTGTIGGKVELSAGDDADIIASYPKNLQSPPFGPGTQLDLTQAYVSYTGGPVTVILGKFETLAGAELIEATGNTNYSRSILNGFAIPFTHTGGRLTYTATPQLNLIVGANKGWDVTRTLAGDSNALTLELGAAWNPSKYFSLTTQGYSGNVEPGGAVIKSTRSLLDLVATYHASDALSFVLNPDFGSQTNSGFAGGGFGTAKWSGVAGYVNYVFSPKFSASLRGEYFNDQQGIRTGLIQKWGEATLTGTYNLNSNVFVRAEVRGDKSNAYYFLDKTGAGYLTNTQFGMEIVAHT